MRRESLRPLLPLYNHCKGSNRSRIVLALGLVFLCLYLFSAICQINDDERDSSYLVSAFGDFQILEYLGIANHTTLSPPSEVESTANITVPAASLLPPTTCEGVRIQADELSDIVWYSPDELSQDLVLQGWEDDWIADGVLSSKDKIKTPNIDIIYTYVESTDAFLAMKSVFDAETEMSKKPSWSTSQARRYRSWNELRYSIRGAVQYGKEWLSKIHVVAKDFEVLDAETNETSYVLQTPSWLNTSHIEQADSMLSIVPESTMLNTTLCGPTFNSMSVEASLSNVQLTGDHFIGMSDDMMFGKKISSSDFVSPLFGMSFSPYLDIWRVDEDSEPDLKNGEQGEGHAVRYTSYLLNQRFGKRPRSLQIHQAKMMNQKIFKEALQTFPRAAKLTPLSRYRDDSQQLYAWYLHMHFTAEMHREALLWSIALKMDSDEDGIYCQEEREWFIEELESGLKKHDVRTVPPMFPLINDRLKSAGLEPLAVQTPIWTSMDGPMYNRDLKADKCDHSFVVETCLGAHFLSSSGPPSPFAFFDQMTSTSLPVECGDCIIKSLLNHAEIGLSPLLPAKDGIYRDRALRAIHKYSHLQSMPENTFTMVRSIPDARGLPNLITHMPGLLCINDDVMTRDQATIAKIAGFYNQLFNGAYPIPSPFENMEPKDETEPKS